MFLYYQFHTEAALGGFLYNLATVCGEFGALCVGKWGVGHLFHHKVEGSYARLLAVGDADGYGTILRHRAVEHLIRQPLCSLQFIGDAVLVAEGTHSRVHARANLRESRAQCHQGLHSAHPQGGV